MKTKLGLVSLCVCIILLSCQKEQLAKPLLKILDPVESKVASGGQVFTLGQSYGGSCVFFIDATGKNGLILSVDNVSGGPFKYGNSISTAVIRAFSNDGQINTSKIIQFYGGVPKNTTPYAALAAKKYKGRGYNDLKQPERRLAAVQSRIQHSES